MESLKANKIQMLTISVLIIAISILTFLYIREIQEDKHEFQGFLNNFYATVDTSLLQIEYLIEGNPQGERLDEGLNSLEDELLKTDTLLKSGVTFVDNDIYVSSFFRDASFFLNGFKMKGSSYFSVAPMSEDGQLDEQELALLKTIKKSLKQTKQAMYSEETHQENPNLSVKDFSEIIITYANKEPNEIYKEAILK